MEIDINVTEEGSNNINKCSRKHAIIKMKRDGEFYIKNIGKLVMYPLMHFIMLYYILFGQINKL